jgi:hypothetical protein
MIIKNKMALTYILFGIMFVCMFAMFALDGRYANNPQTPNSAVGRVFEHSIRLRGQVYLTAGEYAPYVWLSRILIVSGASIVLLHAVSFLWRRIRRFVSPPGGDRR